jgi:hypothetical protein
MPSFTSAAANPGHPWRRAGFAAAVLSLLPATAMAQNNGAGGGRRGGMGGGGMAGLVTPAEMRQVIDGMDLPADKKSAVDDVLQTAQSDLRESMQGLRDASQDERQQKVQDLVKTIADAKTKVEARLTPEQKTLFAKKLSGLTVTRSEAAVAAEKKAAATVDVPADKKSQLSDLFDDATKTLDGYQADADAVTDDAAGAALAQKVQRTVQDTNRQLVEILGQADARKVVQAGRQAMRPNAGGATGVRRRMAATTRSTV